MKRIFKPLLFAYSFLTITPGLGKIRVEPEDIGMSTVFYPLVGATLGFCVALFGLLPGLSELTLSAMICIALLILTRGMHADGLIDTFDGFLSGKREKKQVLAIMKDSRVGALGFIAAFSLYVLKICVVYELLRHEPSGLSLSVVFAPALSRGGVAAAAAFFPPASGEGLGSSYISSTKKRHALFSFLFMILFSLRKENPLSLLLALAALSFWIVWALICKRRIGGMCGDTMGAGIELSELFCLGAALLLSA